MMRKLSIALPCPAPRGASGRAGFTLIELMVVIAVVLILATMTAVVYTGFAPAERVRSSARSLQSAILGARDRAIFSKEVRGVRLVLDPQEPTHVRSLVYIGAPQLHSAGQIRLGRPDADFNGVAESNVVRTVRGYNTGWKALFDSGLLTNGARIRIPKVPAGSWYNVSTAKLAAHSGKGPEVLELMTDFRNTTPDIAFGTPLSLGAGNVAGTVTDDDGDGAPGNNEEIGWPGSDDTTDIHAFSSISDYELELAAGLLPGAQPIPLEFGTVVFLPLSKIPGAWGSGANFTNRMDILFSPRGTVAGGLSSQGLVSLLIVESGDAERLRGSTAGADVVDSNIVHGHTSLVTLYTQTGAALSSPVNQDFTNGKTIFYFAETGEVQR